MAERLLGGGPYVNEVAARQSLLAGGAYFDDSTAGDGSVALTGVVGTGALGDLAKEIVKTLTGEVGTGAAGTLSPGGASTQAFISWAEFQLPASAVDGTVNLAGVSAAGGIGSLSPSSSAQTQAFISWAEAELPAGTAGEDVTIALTGVSSAGAIGEWRPATAKTLAGLGATGTAGILQAVSGAFVQLSGVTATSAIGTFATGQSQSLVGVQVAGTTGVFEVRLNEVLGVAGTLGPSVSLQLSGFAASGGIGTFLPVGEQGGTVSLELVGVGASGAIGAFTPEIELGTTYVALTGVSASGAVSTFGIDAGVILPGVLVYSYVHEFFKPEPVVLPVEDRLVGGTGARSRPRTSTRFRPLGPRIKLNEVPEDLWVRDDEVAPPPPPRAAPPPMAPPAPMQARALPQDMPMLARPQTGPVSQQAPATPGQAVNEFLATLNELAVAAGLDPSVIADMESVDAIDVSDVFNDMR